jgi:hypothetical protein
MHLPIFWCDGESSFCIGKFGENWGTKQGATRIGPCTGLLVPVTLAVLPGSAMPMRNMHVDVAAQAHPMRQMDLTVRTGRRDAQKYSTGLCWLRDAFAWVSSVRSGCSSPPSYPIQLPARRSLLQFEPSPFPLRRGVREGIPHHFSFQFFSLLL